MSDWLRKVFGGSNEPERVLTDTSSGGVYSGLRRQALTIRRAEASIPSPTVDAPIWGVVMETGYAEATATLVSLGDGTTSLYFSNGGGVIGGHSHASVRSATASFIETANNFRQQMRPCDSFPIPSVGRTIFYAHTDSGTLTAEAAEDDLGYGRHTLSPLFYAGQEVITQLRMMSEKTEGEEAK